MTTASARALLFFLPRQLTTPLRLAFAPSRAPAPARGYFFSFSVLQQPHFCWSRAAAATSYASSSSCEQYPPPQAPIAAAPGATCPREEKGKGDGAEAARLGEKAAGAPSPPAPPKEDKAEALRAAAAAGRKGRCGTPPSPRQRGRTAAKPQGKRPALPGGPKEGRGGGGGIIHDVPPRSSSSSPSSSSSTSSTRLRATKK